MQIVRGADNLFRIKGTTRKSDGVALDNTNEGATSLFRLYNKGKAHLIHAAVTRLRTANLSTVTFEIPHLVPQWLEAGDLVLVETDEGEVDQLVVDAVTPGTDEATPATNFDTFTTTAAVAGACRVGSKVTLFQKSATARLIPLSGAPSGRLVVGDEVEIQRNDLTVVTVTANRVWSGVFATEDGVRAPNHSDDPAVVQLPANLGATADPGRRLRVKIGGDFAMSEFPSGGAGTPPDPAVWKLAGGFSGSIPDDQAGLSLGDLIEVEVLFDAGAGLFLVDQICESVT